MDCLVIKLSIIVANVVQFGFSKSKCIKPFTIVSGTLEIYFLFICFGVFLKIDLVSFFMCLVVFLVFKIWIFFYAFQSKRIQWVSALVLLRTMPCGQGFNLNSSWFLLLWFMDFYRVKLWCFISLSLKAYSFIVNIAYVIVSLTI